MSLSVEALLREFTAMAGSMPLSALQAAAMLGMLGAALVLTRRSGLPIVRREIYLGLALGVVGYTIAWFIADFMRNEVKPNLTIDILILAGLLGGWRGGVACLTIMIGARLQFGGSANILPALLDNSVHVLAGCLLRSHLHPGLLQAFSVRTVLIVWGVRIVSTFAGLLLAGPFADISGEMLGRLVMMRATMLPLSLFILYAALLMVYVDAQTDVQREREARLAAARDQAAQDLAESEARFRRLFEHAPVALSFADPQGRIVGVNSHFRRLLGYTLLDIPTMTDWWSAAYPDPDYRRESAACWDSEVRRAVKAGRDIPPGKFRVAARNGKRRTVLVAGAVIAGDILSSFQDVTEQEAAEAALRESEERYRQLFEESRDALMVLGPPDWRFVQGNKASWALFAVDEGAAFKAYSPWMLAPEFQPDGRNSRDGAKEMIAVALRDGACQFEWLHRSTTGRRFPAIVQLTRFERDGVAFVQANVRDISAQKRAEIVIRDSEERLRNLFERVEKISVQAYDESRRVIFWNKASEALYGYSAEEALGRRREDLIIPSGMRALTIAAMENWLTAGVPIPAGELELQRKDGSVVTVFSSPTMMQTSHGREMYSVDIDLTEVRQAHARLELAASVVQPLP
jgi:PAS domain S-box-containing protein